MKLCTGAVQPLIPIVLFRRYCPAGSIFTENTFFSTDMPTISVCEISNNGSLLVHEATGSLLVHEATGSLLVHEATGSLLVQN